MSQRVNDAQTSHLTPLRRLQSRLASDAFTWDNALLTHAVSVFLGASCKLEFQSLRHAGVWARWSGATGLAARSFSENYDGVVRAAAGARQEFEVLSREYRAHTSSARRLIVELEMEYRALDRGVDKACERLGPLLHAGAGAESPRAHPGPTPVLSAQLERFRRVSALAREVTLLGQNVLERRTELLQQVKLDLHGFDKVWLRWAGNVGTHVRHRRCASAVLDKAAAVHLELITRLEFTRAACKALQMEEHAMARRLALLRDCLESP